MNIYYEEYDNQNKKVFGAFIENAHSYCIENFIFYYVDKNMQCQKFKIGTNYKLRVENILKEESK